MKTLVPPPAKAKIENTYLMFDETELVTARHVVEDFASDYRYRRGIVAKTQYNLLRFASVNYAPVCVGLSDGRPYFYFRRELVAAWLAAGGKTWIIAELEALSSKRVVPFSRA